MTTPTRPPVEVHYLERVAWETDLAIDPPGEWSVSCQLDGPNAGDGFDVTATLDGTTWSFEFETHDMKLGVWRWQIWGVHATEGRRVLERGQFELLPGYFEGARDAETSTHASRMLALVEARLEGRIPLDSESYSINNRSLSRIGITDLLELRRIYRIESESERRCLESGVRPGRRRRIKLGFV